MCRVRLSVPWKQEFGYLSLIDTRRLSNKVFGNISTIVLNKFSYIVRVDVFKSVQQIILKNLIDICCCLLVSVKKLL